MTLNFTCGGEKCKSSDLLDNLQLSRIILHTCCSLICMEEKLFSQFTGSLDTVQLGRILDTSCSLICMEESFSHTINEKLFARFDFFANFGKLSTIPYPIY